MYVMVCVCHGVGVELINTCVWCRLMGTCHFPQFVIPLYLYYLYVCNLRIWLQLAALCPVAHLLRFLDLVDPVWTFCSLNCITPLIQLLYVKGMRGSKMTALPLIVCSKSNHFVIVQTLYNLKIWSISVHNFLHYHAHKQINEHAELRNFFLSSNVTVCITCICIQQLWNRYVNTPVCLWTLQCCDWPDPLCLIQNFHGHEMEVNPRTFDKLCEVEEKLVPVCVVGLYRTGKSYLLNRLAGKKSGLSIHL